MNLRYYFPVAALSVISAFGVSPSLGQDGAPQLLDGLEYQTDGELSLFDEATIERVER